MNSIGARVHLVYGTETELRHWLVLGGLEKPTAPSKPVVFISSSAADAQIVSDLRKALQTDFDFFDASNVPSGEAWSSSISEVLRSSDAVMAVFSDATSSWTSSEVEEATAFNLPVVPVMIGPNTKPPEGLHHISWNIIRVSEGRQWNPSELQTAGKKIASALHQQLGASRSKENTMPEQQRRPHILHGRGDAIRIVPLHDPARHMAEAAAAPAHLTYRNGPLLTNVEVFTVFWGTPWQAAEAGLKTQIEQFFDFILSSSLIDQLSEYSCPGKTIGHGTRTGSAIITNPMPHRTVSDQAIQVLLQHEIQTNSAFPQPNPNTLYFVYLPPGISVVQGGSRSCQAFCGYHNDINGQIFYAMMPYPGCSGCLGGMGPFDALTGTSSHELCESITDPIPGQGWYDDNNGEIGDICAWNFKKVGNYTVQLEWSNKENKCV